MRIRSNRLTVGTDLRLRNDRKDSTESLGYI